MPWITRSDFFASPFPFLVSERRELLSSARICQVHLLAWIWFRFVFERRMEIVGGSEGHTDVFYPRLSEPPAARSQLEAARVFSALSPFTSWRCSGLVLHCIARHSRQPSSLQKILSSRRVFCLVETECFLRYFILYVSSQLDSLAHLSTQSVLSWPSLWHSNNKAPCFPLEIQFCTWIKLNHLRRYDQLVVVELSHTCVIFLSC